MIDKQASREFRKQIGRILLEQWDPIGVRDEPAARDEYDGYVYGVFRLLLDRAPDEAIAAHLLGVERDRMGLDGTPETHRLAVAGALRAIPVPGDASRPSA
jgi:hypothetical protein